MWGAFPSSPKLDHITDHEAVLCADFDYVAPDGSTWTAPAGMRFDGASIPAALWSLFRESPFAGDAAWPAIIHDAGCKGLVRVNGGALVPGGLGDARVHRAFHDGIRARGGSRVKAWLFYRAVWACGMLRGGYTT